MNLTRFALKVSLEIILNFFSTRKNVFVKSNRVIKPNDLIEKIISILNPVTFSDQLLLILILNRLNYLRSAANKPQFEASRHSTS